ncbi:histidine phosphatase superfamily [Lineolata rhizophorae]|uniref:Histidine phosphatase superfamily n=1 Tax=Lineolata rhizophorae TaxID=578093 RepID=A0A6A6NTB9_9PEZI|nr:histidine phosphatase superfamily [Lineolata rhizophorae]
MPPTLILIRHAQALHNVSKEYTIPDPGLSELGLRQSAELQDHLRNKFPLADDVELIIASPMRRTLQTAAIGFEWLIGRGTKVELNAGWQENSDKPCDTGSPVETISPDFPLFDFSSLAATDWPSKTSPTSPYFFSRSAVLARGQACLADLYSRPEKVIAVVTHSGFLRTAVCARHFGNADYRVFDFVDGGKGKDGKWELREWEEMEKKGGGLGTSWTGPAPIEPGDFPEEEEDEEKGRIGNEATTEMPS